MVASCVWIAIEAILRILHPSRLTLRFSIWPFVVLLLSIIVDSARSAALHRVAKTHRSEALEADAVHFGTDIWSSAAVIVGLLFSFAGQRWNLPALRYADPIAALVVAAIILQVTWRLAHKTLDSLLDATPPEVRDKIQGQILRDRAGDSRRHLGTAAARAPFGLGLLCRSHAWASARSELSALGTGARSRRRRRCRNGWKAPTSS